jgi:hypothetical protein
VAEDRLRTLGLAERHEARALVVGDVQAVAVEVHAVAPLLGARLVDGLVRLILGVVERAGGPQAGVRSGFQRVEPCLRGRIQAPPCMVLTTTNQAESVSRLAVVGGQQAPRTEDPAAQRLVLGFRCWLERQLVPRSCALAVGKVEGRPAAEPGQMPGDGAQPPPLPDRLRLLQEAGHGAEVLMEVGQHHGRGHLGVHLVQAQDAGLHGIQHVVADVGGLHGAGQVPQLHAQCLGQHGAAGDAEHAEERAALHVAIRRVAGRRGKPAGTGGDDDGGDPLDHRLAAGAGTPPLHMSLLPAGFPLRQQLPEYAKQRATGRQLPFAEQDELLRRDLRARLDLGEVGTVIADPVSERLLCQPGREPATAQLCAQAPGALLHGICL